MSGRGLELDEYRETTYESRVLLAGGVEVTVRIDVPVSAGWPDQGECSELAAAGLNTVVGLLARDDGVTVDRPRPVLDPWAIPPEPGKRRAEVDPA